MTVIVSNNAKKGWPRTIAQPYDEPNEVYNQVKRRIRLGPLLVSAAERHKAGARQSQLCDAERYLYDCRAEGMPPTA